MSKCRLDTSKCWFYMSECQLHLSKCQHSEQKIDTKSKCRHCHHYCKTIKRIIGEALSVASRKFAKFNFFLKEVWKKQTLNLTHLLISDVSSLPQTTQVKSLFLATFRVLWSPEFLFRLTTLIIVKQFINRSLNLFFQIIQCHCYIHSKNLTQRPV